MANWVDQDLNLRLAGQPWTSAKATADAENTVAQAEGAPGAPRNHGKSLAESILADTSLAAVADSITITDVPEYTRYGVYFDNVRLTSSNSVAFQVALSSDNGATFPFSVLITESLLWNVSGLFGKVELSQSFGCTTLLNLSRKKGAIMSGDLAIGVLDFTDQISAIRISVFGNNIAIGSRIILTGILDRIEVP